MEPQLFLHVSNHSNLQTNIVTVFPVDRKLIFFLFVDWGGGGASRAHAMIFVDWELSTGLELTKACRLGWSPCQTKTTWVPRARARARDSFCFAFTLRGRFFGFCLSAGLPSDVGPDWAPQQKIHRHIRYYDSWESFL